MTRRRNMLEHCALCAAPVIRCLCEAMPRLELRTRICLIIHHRELTRSSNTGLLAARALVNSEIRVRGESRAMLDLRDLLVPCYRTFLFYPCEDAVELDGSLVEREPTPIQLIVPDGTWRQARKIYTRHRELKDVPRVKLGVAGEPVFQLRAQSRPDRMATLQAIAQALSVIEGTSIGAQLMNLYHAKVERALIGRGVFRPAARDR